MSPSDPVVVTAVFDPLPGARDALVARLAAAIPEVHAEEGCILYALHEAAGGSLVLVEKWSSTAALDAHAAGEAVRRLDAAVAPLLRSPTVVERLRPIPAGSASQGAIPG